MLALSLIFVISVILPSKLKGQSVSINQQQQNINNEKEKRNRHDDFMYNGNRLRRKARRT